MDSTVTGRSLEPRSCETPAIARRRLVPLVLVVTALLAVVAIAAHGRPLGTGSGRSNGLPAAFWDYAFTTLLIAEVSLALIAFAALFFFRRDPSERKPYSSRTARALAILLVVAALLTFFGRHVNLFHILHPNTPARTTPTTPTPTVTGKNAKQHKPAPSRQVHFQWPELVAFVAVLLGLGAFAYATRRRLMPPIARHAPEVLAAALDESLDDLRTDPDLRRAIIAAYARMERALGAAGIPRHPAEAPLEDVERALLTLDTSAAAVRRLTDLFLWARFSQHEPDPSMRDEAVDALVAVRDELRASEPAPA
jgi:hypothetical protein